MTVALAAVAVIASVVAATLALLLRRQVGVARRDQESVDVLEQERSEAITARAQAEQSARAAEVRANAAEARLRAAEVRVHDAERKAGDAERRVADAMRLAHSAEQQAAARTGQDEECTWELERLRVEREWLDVVGPGEPLPCPWDGTIGAVVATELAVIREVMGTPSELELAGEPPAEMTAGTAKTVRVCVELLRRVARSGYELSVILTPQELLVAQHAEDAEHEKDLEPLAAAALRAGVALTLEVSDGRLSARVGF